MTSRAAQAFHDAWDHHQPATDDVAALVRLAAKVGQSAYVSARPDFVGDLRLRLMAEAAVSLTPDVTVPRPRRSLPAASKVSVAGFAAAGLVSLIGASAQAIPGETLYPIKRGLESFHASLQKSDAERSTSRFVAAERRLDEAAELAANGSPAAQARAADAIDEFVIDGRAGIESLFSRGLNLSEVPELPDFVARALVTLAELRPMLDDEGIASYEAAKQFLSDLAAQLQAAVPVVPAGSATSPLAPSAPALAPMHPQAPIAAPAVPTAPGGDVSDTEPEPTPEPASELAESSDPAGILAKIVGGLLR